MACLPLKGWCVYWTMLISVYLKINAKLNPLKYNKMKIKLSILFFVLAAAYGSIHAQQTINASLEHGGLTRDYILYIPASYDPATPSPIVMSFHGYTSTAQINFGYTNFTSIADTAGFILVHPQGALLNGLTHWNVGGWTLGSTVDDVGFVSTLLDTLLIDYNIDEDRVYSTGMSNGGYMSFLLACQLSDRIAAIASVTGSMTPQTYNACDPQHPTPVLQIHGTADGTVPYTGNPAWTRSIDDVLQYWVAYNHCDPDAIVSNVPDINMTDGSTVDNFVFSDGEHCVSTEHFKVYEGDHDWPGAWGNMDINASYEVWRFLSQYDINGLIDCDLSSTIENNTLTNDLLISPNPAFASIKIEGISEGLDFVIYSIVGEKIFSGKLDQHNQSIDIAHLIPQVYFINVGTRAIKFIKLK